MRMELSLTIVYCTTKSAKGTKVEFCLALGALLAVRSPLICRVVLVLAPLPLGVRTAERAPLRRQRHHPQLAH